MEVKKILILLGCACLAGCMPHIKAQDSYGMMFHEAPNKNAVGDPYTFGGIGESTGGLVPTTDWGDVPRVNVREEAATGTLHHTGGETATDKVASPAGGVQPVPGGSTTETPADATGVEH